MRRKRNNSGFTMAELLIVIAILGVLSAVSFVAVQNRQRSLSQAEVDSIAKEIFIAAQNHLTMAESQNYLGVKDTTTLGAGEKSVFGSQVDESDNSVYYIVKNDSETPEPSSSVDMFNQILPFGSIDATVRQGNYIIRYQPKSALVLDVFYCYPSGQRYGGGLSESDYKNLIELRDISGGSNKSARLNYHGMIVGWYGGEEAAQTATGKWLEAPQIEIINAEKLQVKVTDTNKDNGESGVTLQLIIKGLDLENKETGAQKVITITRITDQAEYVIILDDITTEGAHFNDLFTSLDGFIPGQNISVQAVAFNTEAISNIGYSDIEITNSLFEDISVDEKEEGGVKKKTITASINNIRHLENLEESVSGLDTTLTFAPSLDKFNLQNAVQTSDMNWTIFKGKTHGDDTIVYLSDATATEDATDCYYPVSPGYSLNYNGRNYNIYDVRVRHSGGSGLFGTMVTGSAISNLELIDFDIEDSSGNAGALAGTMTGTNVTNVLARNSKNAMTLNVSAANGAAGGLIGSVSGGTVKKCAAALIVSGKDAGGLIGKASGTAAVTGSYSGGHTVSGAYDATSYNVTGSTSAGGLIGDAGKAAIENCYSTCSVGGDSDATVTGGFIGKAEGASISSSYCTGLVSGTGDNAFIGSGTVSVSTEEKKESYYFSIINEIITTDDDGNVTAITYKGPGNDNVLALDDSAAVYDGFSLPTNPADYKWQKARVYDNTLITYYGEGETGNKTARFNFRTVEQLGYTPVYHEDQKDAEGKITAYADFVLTHYGDWPAPEIFVFNTKES